MLIVVSHGGKLEGEAAIVNALFEEGLECFHLRKPEATEYELTAFMQEIDPVFYPKIAWHQCHHLAFTYNSKRLHFPTWMRDRTDAGMWKLLMSEQCILTTSIHAGDAVLSPPSCFAYTFAGPVFNSISKTGYAALRENERMKLAFNDTVVKRIAIGGIDYDNCNAVRILGVQGIAVSGAIWQASHPLHSFKKIRSAWHTTDPL